MQSNHTLADFETAHFGTGRALAQTGFELIESGGGANGVDQDAAIILIARVTGEGEIGRVSLNENAVADALHTPAHRVLPGGQRNRTVQSVSPAALACSFSSMAATLRVN